VRRTYSSGNPVVGGGLGLLIVAWHGSRDWTSSGERLD
jgi:hypothetical protein